MIMKKATVMLVLELEVADNVDAKTLADNVEGALDGSDFAKRLWGLGDFMWSSVSSVSMKETFYDVDA